MASWSDCKYILHKGTEAHHGAMKLATSFALFLSIGAIQHMHAASVFTVNVGGVVTSGPGPVGDVFEGPLTRDGAFSGNGTLRTRTLDAAPATNALTGFTNGSAASASAFIDDIIFKGPAPTVQTRLLLPFDGLVSVQSQELVDGVGDIFFGNSRGDISLTAQMSCFNCGLGFFLNGRFDASVDMFNGPSVATEQQSTHSFLLNGPFVLEISSFFIGHAFAGVDKTNIWGYRGAFDTGIITVPTNTPITLSFNMSISDIAGSQAIADASAAVDAFHTFGLPQGTPVFDLPAGFTAEAASIGMVNNVIPSDVAPEPMPVGLMLGGFAMLWMRRRRR